MQLRVEGIEATLAKLRAVKGVMAADGAVGDVLLEGAQIFRNEAEYLAPRGKTGDLKRSLKADKILGKYAWAFAAVDFKRIRRAGTDKRMNRYPYIVEYGAKPHEISGKNGRFLYLNGHFAKSVQHPGFSGRSYFRDAVAAKKTPVRKYILDKLKTLVVSAFGGASGGAGAIPTDREIFTGKRGGRYYFADSGNKVYIPRLPK